MKLIRLLTLIIAIFFATNNVFSQQPPPADVNTEETLNAQEDGPPGSNPDPNSAGTAVPLDGAALMGILIGGGLLAGMLRKSNKANKKD